MKNVGCDKIDQRAYEAHAWLAGYSLGFAGKEFAPSQNFTDEAGQNEYRKGYDSGFDRYLVVNPVVTS